MICNPSRDALPRVDLSHPNLGLPEFGTIEWSKPDIFDFDWER